MIPVAGQVYWALLNGEVDRHPVVVVSKAEFNRGDYLIVVPVTSKKFEMRSKLPNCVPFRGRESCFGADCCAQAENITLLESVCVEIEDGPLGVLRQGKMRDLIRAIGYVIDADCEPT